MLPKSCYAASIADLPVGLVEELLDAAAVAGPSWGAAVVVQLTWDLPLRRNIKFYFIYSCCGTGFEVVGLFHVREENNSAEHLYCTIKQAIIPFCLFFMAGVSPNIKKNKIDWTDP